ncbi:MAG: DUF1573 domain-containing protein [Euryarchaeota archaeon]|nr:DUF1573 domain-containing protein [Euryarchaeota archaeon]
MADLSGGRLAALVVAVFVLGGAGGIAAAKLATPSGGGVKVSYEEIYDTFQCPCCGQPISADCCQLAIERKGYATGLIDAGLDRMQVMEKYVARYGVESFRDEAARVEFREYLIKKAPRERPQIEVSPASADLGNVSVRGPEVVTTFQVKNTGSKKLVITNLATSCGCTTASLVVKGVEGPRFGMDMGQGSGPEEWEAELAPGESATLKVYYDPGVHPDLKGYVIREVYIYSNDPVDPVVKVRIFLNQVE